MDKQNGAYPHSQILLCHKKEWSPDSRCDMDNLENIVLSEGSQTQIGDSISMKSPKEVNLERQDAD